MRETRASPEPAFVLARDRQLNDLDVEEELKQTREENVRLAQQLSELSKRAPTSGMTEPEVGELQETRATRG